MTDIILCVSELGGSGASTLAQLMARALEPMGRPIHLIGCDPLAVECERIRGKSISFKVKDLRKEYLADQVFREFEAAPNDAIFILDLSAASQAATLSRDADIYQAFSTLPPLNFKLFYIVSLCRGPQWIGRLEHLYEAYGKHFEITVVFNERWGSIEESSDYSNWLSEGSGTQMSASGLQRMSLPRIPRHLFPDDIRFSKDLQTYHRQKPLLGPLYKRLATAVI